MKASKLVKQLQALIKSKGDLEVAYQSDYDWVMVIDCTDIVEGDGADGAPDGKYIALN